MMRAASEVAAFRCKLVDAGYCPIPLYGKVPPVYGKNNSRRGFDGWQKLNGVTRELIGMDTTTPAGKAMFQMMGVFAEFERAMIVERVKSGLRLARLRGTKSGRPIGRPRVPEHTRKAIRAAYKAGDIGMRSLAKRYGVSLGTVQTLLNRNR